MGLRRFAFDDTQFTHGQLIDFQRLEACLFYLQAADRNSTDRQRADGDRANRNGAQRQCQQAASSGNGICRLVTSRAISASVWSSELQATANLSPRSPQRCRQIGVGW